MNRWFVPAVCAGLCWSTMAFGQGGGAQELPSFDVFQVKPINGSNARVALGAPSNAGGGNQGGNGQGGFGQGSNGQGGSGLVGSSQGGSSQSGSNLTAGKSGFAGNQSVTSLALPHWSYSVKDVPNGKTYTGNIVGPQPSSTATAASVGVVLVPVIFKLTQGGKTYTFDPTAADSNCLAGKNAFALTQASPVFSKSSFTINGAAISNTTYGDAFLQAEFWSSLGKTSKQLLNLNVTTGPALTISATIPSSGSSTATVYSFTGSECGESNATLGVVYINSVDAILQSYISSQRLSSSQFPFFVTYNAVMSVGAANNLNNCCVLGYHNAVGAQTYGIGNFDGYDDLGSLFGPAFADVAAISHEINEWINDPSGTNPTPAWGNIGQVSGCQSDFEVGDPLSGTGMPAINLGGFNYHLQELAFYSWFYGGTSLGAGGVYSSNGTFKGYAKPCPPGGTN